MEEDLSAAYCIQFGFREENNQIPCIALGFGGSQITQGISVYQRLNESSFGGNLSIGLIIQETEGIMDVELLDDTDNAIIISRLIYEPEQLNNFMENWDRSIPIQFLIGRDQIPLSSLVLPEQPFEPLVIENISMLR